MFILRCAGGMFIASAGFLGVLPGRVDAAFPAKTFSPYLEIDSGANLEGKLTTVKSTTNQPYYTLAFILASSSDQPVWGDNGPTATGTTYLMEDFFYAGGLPGLMGRIAEHLHLDCMTVTGRTLGDLRRELRERFELKGPWWV